MNDHGMGAIGHMDILLDVLNGKHSVFIPMNVHHAGKHILLLPVDDLIQRPIQVVWILNGEVLFVQFQALGYRFPKGILSQEIKIVDKRGWQ